MAAPVYVPIIIPTSGGGGGDLSTTGLVVILFVCSLLVGVLIGLYQWDN